MTSIHSPYSQHDSISRPSFIFLFVKIIHTDRLAFNGISTPWFIISAEFSEPRFREKQITNVKSLDKLDLSFSKKYVQPLRRMTTCSIVTSKNNRAQYTFRNVGSFHSDVSCIVRTNDSANRIGHATKKFNLPAVQIDEDEPCVSCEFCTLGRTSRSS